MDFLLLGTIIGSASFGAIAGKLIDTYLLSRVNEKIEKTKWLRQEKLEAFSKLSQEITSLGFENHSFADEWKLHSLAARSILLINNKKLEKRIRYFIKQLINFTTNEYPKIMNQTNSIQIKLPNGANAGENELKIGILLEKLQEDAFSISYELKIDLENT